MVGGPAGGGRFLYRGIQTPRGGRQISFAGGTVSRLRPNESSHLPSVRDSGEKARRAEGAPGKTGDWNGRLLPARFARAGVLSLPWLPAWRFSSDRRSRAGDPGASNLSGNFARRPTLRGKLHR